MKAMALLNIATEADLATGLIGTTDNIILDPREIVEANESSTMKPKLPPATVIFGPCYLENK